ncbi:putative nuclease HARBI1 [Eriocheir sinensis]|uniref:putative nuclease HARBI1 n=1 Tax=Eriocheir sinensis TaxID=95602 RepID=UPI0021C9ACB5|nr:putative nuclease HARBI1 [Eriocheir sinensis]XP_050687165.1 putative nuclease HARBI1 [Eriocheir sinensis]
MELLAAHLFERNLRRERRYRDPLDPLQVSDEHLLRHYRMPRHEILRLCDELSPLLSRATKRAHAIPTHTQVLVTLRFLASGTFQNVIADTTGLTQPSVSRIISSVTNILYEKAKMEIKMPTNIYDVNRTAAAFSFIGGFPRVIGAIDCTHIPIKAPIENEHIYVNRKSFHSLNVQVICNAEMLITSFSVKYPGATNDAFIWRNCPLRDRFEAGTFRDFHLLGDCGYPLEPYLLTPFHDPMTEGERQYNRSHKTTRVIIEQTFGVLKSRRCLHCSGGSLQYDPKKCAKIAATCMWLHNRCIRRRIPMIAPVGNDDGMNNDNDIIHGDHNPTGQDVRREIVEGFFT